MAYWTRRACIYLFAIINTILASKFVVSFSQTAPCTRIYCFSRTVSQTTAVVDITGRPRWEKSAESKKNLLHKISQHKPHFSIYSSKISSSTSGYPAAEVEQRPIAASKEETEPILGPPSSIATLKIGHSLSAYRTLTSGHRHEFCIERVSTDPDVFLLRGLASAAECAEIMTASTANIMNPAETITENDTSSRTGCGVCWLGKESGGAPPAASSLLTCVANLMVSEGLKVHPKTSVEELQVLRYDVGGQFIFHHDGPPRFLTVIYYLNGVGGTWFPLALTSDDESDDSYGSLEKERMSEDFLRVHKSGIKGSPPQNKAQALRLGEDLEPEKDGLLIKGSKISEGDTNIQEEKTNNNIVHIQQGDAVAFYNYLDDRSGRLNWRALHAGLPTSKNDGPKWICTHWFGFDGH